MSNYTNYYSGAVATMCGVHNIFYSNNCNNFLEYAEKHNTPVFMDELRNLGYNFFVSYAASLNWPGFYRNIYYNTGLTAESDADEEPSLYKREIIATERFINFLNSKPKDPFFAVVHYDSLHGYSQNPDMIKFRPYNEFLLDYSALETSQMRLSRFNVYKNAAYHVDSLIGKIWNNKNFQELLKDSIVIITADHGEEFFESGINYHGSRFNEWQTHVPFLFYFPGSKPKVVEANNSGFNIVPTILELLGYGNDHSGYAIGKSFLNPDYKDDIIHFATQKKKGCLINNTLFFVESNGRMSAKDFYTYSDLQGSVNLIKENAKNINQCIDDLNRFD